LYNTQNKLNKKILLVKKIPTALKKISTKKLKTSLGTGLLLPRHGNEKFYRLINDERVALHHLNMRK